VAGRLTRPLLSLAFVLCLPLAAVEPAATLEPSIARAARERRWDDVLALLVRLQRETPERYAEGRFDYLTARALASTGRTDEALPRFEHLIASGDLFDVPARLSAARIRFLRGEGAAALDHLFPLLQRKDSPVARRAIRIALDALETRFDPSALSRLVTARPDTGKRERRRILALQSEALERDRKELQAAALRASLLAEARRDDAAAIVLARELKGLTPADLPDSLLALLIDTARAQRDLELAERLAVERDARARKRGEPLDQLTSAFDLARLRASRGKFALAADDFRAILQSHPKPLRPGRSRKDDAPGTPAFLGRIRFNLGAVLEKTGDLDGAARELEKVERGGIGPSGLAALQRARLEIRRDRLETAERILFRERLAREPGRTEGILLLLSRRAEKGEAPAAARALSHLEALAKRRRLPDPWKSELPFWQGRVAEAAGSTPAALAAYARVLAERPYSAVGEMARRRFEALPEVARSAFLKARRGAGETALRAGKAAEAKALLTPGALLGDSAARDLLRVAYQKLPAYSAILLAPAWTDDLLYASCGDAAACRLLQLGLAEEAEPIAREFRRLDTVTGCIVAVRIAEEAGAGPASLEAAEALDRKIPDDFLLDMAPAGIARALTPRPYGRLVAETAKEHQVPEDLLYAVMRQESRFDREAVSPAAARGLMQLTLPAAVDAALELNESPPAYAELYDAARSLRLGARTLRSLLDRFGGDGPSAVSGYNAGAGQTSLWIAGGKNPSEALLAATTYPETRAYFRRVLTNRILYSLEP
jgi:soluble lytic murein transglycosylase-like protein